VDDMIGFLGDAYLWVKAVHIISVIFWMAGMFMLPRYFAYHMEEQQGSDGDRLWQEREKKLLRIIIDPAMGLAWILGILLVLNIGLDAGGWLHVKLAVVIAFSGFHGYLSRVRRELAAGKNWKSSRFFRRINEIPALAIILVVIMVIVRPF